MSDIQNTLDAVAKTFSTPTYVAGATLVRENLDSFIDRLGIKETPIRARLPRKKGAGLAASWNVQSALTAGTSAFAEGALPTTNTVGYVRRSALYKLLGQTQKITDHMIAAGASFVDIESELTFTAMQMVAMDEEALIISGDSTVTPTQFDGLGTTTSGYTVTTVDDASNVAGFRLSLLDTAVTNCLTNYGVRPTAIYTSYTMHKAISESLLGDVRVDLSRTNEVGVGVQASFYQSAV